MMRGNEHGTPQKEVAIAPGGLATSHDFRLLSSLAYAKEITLDPSLQHAAITSFGPGLSLHVIDFVGYRCRLYLIFNF